METWKSIKGYEELYEVSNRGNIRRLHKDIRVPKYKYLKLTKNSKGYLTVQLCKEGKPKGFLVHRLVADSFIDNLHNLECVNHKDGNKINNHVDNLEYLSNKDNIIHARDVLKVDFNKNRSSFISQDRLKEIKYLLDKGLSLKQIQRQLRVSRATIKRHFSEEVKDRTENPYKYRRRMEPPFLHLEAQ